MSFLKFLRRTPRTVNDPAQKAAELETLRVNQQDTAIRIARIQGAVRVLTSGRLTVD